MNGKECDMNSPAGSRLGSISSAAQGTAQQAENLHPLSGGGIASSVAIQLKKLAAPRNILFALACTLSLALYWAGLKNLIALASSTDEYSHTLVIPFLSVALIIRERAKIFKTIRYSLGPGFGLIAAAAVIGVLFGASAPVGNQNTAFALRIMSLVLIWIGAFILCYGRAASRAAAFALTFLLLTVPIPDFLLGKVIFLVRYGSAENVGFLFGLAGLPVLREGFQFVLPSVSIEIATQCSGIHSTMALLIVTLLAGHLFLRSKLKRTVLVLIAIPVVCITNGIRIATLTLLAIYVNRSFLYGRLHHEGGFLFFGLALAIMAGVLYLMGWHRQKSPETAVSSSLPVAE